MASEQSTEKVAQDTTEDLFGVEAPAELAGVNLEEADACPACDGTTGLSEGPAGYYRCMDCWTKWAGDFENASLVIYFADGRAV